MDGKVTAMVPLPIAGLLSGKRVAEVAEQVKALKVEWEKAGCSIPYMGFNLIPLSVIPEIRITDKGLVLVPQMQTQPLFDAACADGLLPAGAGRGPVTLVPPGGAAPRPFSTRPGRHAYPVPNLTGEQAI